MRTEYVFCLKFEKKLAEDWIKNGDEKDWRVTRDVTPTTPRTGLRGCSFRARTDLKLQPQLVERYLEQGRFSCQFSPWLQLKLKACPTTRIRADR